MPVPRQLLLQLGHQVRVGQVRDAGDLARQAVGHQLAGHEQRHQAEHHKVARADLDAHAAGGGDVAVHEVAQEEHLGEPPLDLVEQLVLGTLVGRQVGVQGGADQLAAGGVVEAGAQGAAAGVHGVDHALRGVGQQVLGQAQQEAAIAGQLDPGALVVGEGLSALSDDLVAHQEDRDQARGHLVDLRDRDPVDPDVPAVRALQGVEPHHRVHQPHHGRRAEAGPVPLQRARQQGGGEEGRRLVDPAGGGVVRQSPGQGHRQGGVLVHEGGDERAPDCERAEIGGGVAVQALALADQVHVQPLGDPLHVGDESGQLWRGVGHGLDAFVAGLGQHLDQRAEAVLRHQGRIGVGHHVAQHGVGLDQGDLVGIQVAQARRDAGLGIVGEALGRGVEIDVAIQRRQKGLLRGDLGPDLFQRAHVNLS